MTEKDRLRRDARRRRRSFVRSLKEERRTELERSLAARIAHEVRSADVVASYVPMENEVNPAACEALTDALIVLPYFAARNFSMHFRRAGGPLESGPWGTHQPLADAAAHCPSLVLLPLVAADRNGNRLGQGQGHYDRTLARLRREKVVTAIGLAWDVQIVDECPSDSWDIPLDMIATPGELIRL